MQLLALAFEPVDVTPQLGLGLCADACRLVPRRLHDPGGFLLGLPHAEVGRLLSKHQGSFDRLLAVGRLSGGSLRPIGPGQGLVEPGLEGGDALGHPLEELVDVTGVVAAKLLPEGDGL